MAVEATHTPAKSYSPAVLFAASRENELVLELSDPPTPDEIDQIEAEMDRRLKQFRKEIEEQIARLMDRAEQDAQAKKRLEREEAAQARTAGDPEF
jgi:septal ring factor EnvC (AmiA/AmiB activator)